MSSAPSVDGVDAPSKARARAVDIRLLGECRVLIDGCVLPGLEARKPRELFAYLVLRRQRGAHRDVVAHTLWPECRDARRYLRQTVWQLQKALRMATAPGGVIAVVDGGDERLNVQMPPATTVDVEMVRAGAALATTQPLTQVVFEDLRRVVDLYEGPFLQGRREPWATLERDDIENRLFVIVDALVQDCLGRGAFLEAVEIGLTGLRHDIAREPTHRLVMTAYDLAGNRRAALRQYELCAAALRQELGTAPDRATRSLLERLRRPQAGELRDGGFEDLRSDLLRLQAELRELRASLRR